jgi:hypothetical protein
MEISDYIEEFKDDKTLSIEERIENKAINLWIRMENPTKAYLGRREFNLFNKQFQAKQRILPPPGTQCKYIPATIWTHTSQIEIIKTRHKSYLRVI